VGDEKQHREVQAYADPSKQRQQLLLVPNHVFEGGDPPRRADQARPRGSWQRRAGGADGDGRWPPRTWLRIGGFRANWDQERTVSIRAAAGATTSSRPSGRKFQRTLQMIDSPTVMARVLERINGILEKHRSATRRPVRGPQLGVPTWWRSRWSPRIDSASGGSIRRAMASGVHRP